MRTFESVIRARHRRLGAAVECKPSLETTAWPTVSSGTAMIRMGRPCFGARKDQGACVASPMTNSHAECAGEGLYIPVKGTQLLPQGPSVTGYVEYGGNGGSRNIGAQDATHLGIFADRFWHAGVQRFRGERVAASQAELCRTSYLSVAMDSSFQGAYVRCHRHRSQTHLNT